MNDLRIHAPSEAPPSGVWWMDLYDDLLADVFLEREEEVADTLVFLRRVLGLEPGMRVFDQCCGIGRLAIPLGQQGFVACGCDVIPRYIERALEKAQTAGVCVELATADAFEFTTSVPCDGAFNWWTSFGYVQEDAANMRMLQRAFESLKPSARFALDFMNVPGVLRGFQARTETVRETPWGTVQLVRESQIELREMVMLKKWRYDFRAERTTEDITDRKANRRTVQHHSRVRLYLPHELIALFERAGFGDIELYGDLAGNPLGLDSPRCIVVGRRPE
ncbi:MAG TPA: class I SAM-dependent methyltransferase [Polyangiaceae bacterium]|nr:class I SAM-dependent methyltransferase [Polyangiaceae bacterium]